MDFKKDHGKSFRYFISMPFIYVMIVPLLILDFFLEIYHRVCFPLYGLEKVSRRNYIMVDRHKLRYLSFMERFNCAYCGYANGLLHYASIIAARTEKYWCGIKHSSREGFVPPAHHKFFLPYGDENAFIDFLRK